MKYIEIDAISDGLGQVETQTELWGERWAAVEKAPSSLVSRVRLMDIGVGGGVGSGEGQPDSNGPGYGGLN